MLRPEGRVIMVSGANRGIGLAVARRLAERGYLLSLGSRDVSALQAVAGPWADQALFHAYDATNLENAVSWLEATLDRFGRLDGLVNNAGIAAPPGHILDPDESPFDRMWEVNVKGPLRLIRLAWPHLRASGNGRIVNVASLSGKRVKNDNAAYAMSKHALIALTHATRRLGWESGIRATAICPGFVRTDMTAGVDGIDRQQMIEPADLAQLVDTALSLPDNAVVAEMLINCRLEDLF